MFWRRWKKSMILPNLNCFVIVPNLTFWNVFIQSRQIWYIFKKCINITNATLYISMLHSEQMLHLQNIFNVTCITNANLEMNIVNQFKFTICVNLNNWLISNLTSLENDNSKFKYLNDLHFNILNQTQNMRNGPALGVALRETLLIVDGFLQAIRALLGSLDAAKRRRVSSEVTHACCGWTRNLKHIRFQLVDGGWTGAHTGNVDDEGTLVFAARNVLSWTFTTGTVRT